MTSFPPVRYKTVTPVTAPKPCQTSSRRAEFTSKNSSGVIIFTDRAPKNSENKIRSWASDSEDDEDEEKEEDGIPFAATTTPPAVAPQPTHSNSCRSSGNQYPTPREERVAESVRKREIVELREEGNRKLAVVNERKEHPVVLKVMKRPSHAVTEGEGSATSLTKGTPMVLHQANGINQISEKKDSATEPEIHSPSWVNEMEDSNVDPDEKERRRKNKAMEQQQLILQQVAAARRRTTKTKSAKVAIVKRDVVENSEKQKERVQHQEQRQPRTNGVLFMRISSGQLVRIDRHGEPLASNNSAEEDAHFEEPEDYVAEEHKEQPPSIAESSKKFVPAPIPKVSAWAKVLPAQAKGRTVVKETRHDTDFETEEDHSFDSTQKSLETNADGGKNEQKNASDRHCNKHRNGRRNGKGWSFRNKKGPYERQ